MIAPVAVAGAVVVATGGTELVSNTHPFGWLGPIVLALLGGFTVWHSGALKAWKETAEARDGRIGDLESELAELRSELAIPERIEGLVRLMAESHERADARSHERVELIVSQMERGFAELSRVVRESPTRAHPTRTG